MIPAWTPARGPLVREGGGHRPWCESWLTVTLGTSSFLSLSFPVCKVVDVRDCFGKFCKDLEIRYAKHQQSASVSDTRCVPGAVSDHSPGVCRAPGTTRPPSPLPCGVSEVRSARACLSTHSGTRRGCRALPETLRVPCSRSP